MKIRSRFLFEDDFNLDIVPGERNKEDEKVLSEQNKVDERKRHCERRSLDEKILSEQNLEGGRKKGEVKDEFNQDGSINFVGK
jgi:hypothetical protein